MFSHKMVLLGLFLLMSVNSVDAQNWDQSPWEGFYVSFAPVGEPTYGNTLLAITSISEGRYLIVAVSTRDSEHLSFYATGKINERGALIIKTNKEMVLSLSKPYSDFDELHIYDKSGEYNIENCVRLDPGESIPILD